LQWERQPLPASALVEVGDDHRLADLGLPLVGSQS
jgi:hypothetical protein